MTTAPGDDPQQNVPPGYPPYGYYQPPPDHPRATMALVLGIVALVCCQVTGPFAWVIGARAVREIDASGGRLGGRGQAMAGKVLGIIGTILFGLVVLYVVGLVVVLLVAIWGGETSTTFEETRVLGSL